MRETGAYLPGCEQAAQAADHSSTCGVVYKTEMAEQIWLRSASEHCTRWLSSGG